MEFLFADSTVVCFLLDSQLIENRWQPQHYRWSASNRYAEDAERESDG